MAMVGAENEVSSACTWWIETRRFIAATPSCPPPPLWSSISASSLMPSTPPLALISSTACFMPWLITWPTKLACPVIARMAPILNTDGSLGASAARPSAASMASAASAATSVFMRFLPVEPSVLPARLAAPLRPSQTAEKAMSRGAGALRCVPRHDPPTGPAAAAGYATATSGRAARLATDAAPAPALPAPCRPAGHPGRRSGLGRSRLQGRDQAREARRFHAARHPQGRLAAGAARGQAAAQQRRLAAARRGRPAAAQGGDAGGGLLDAHPLRRPRPRRRAGDGDRDHRSRAALPSRQRHLPHASGRDAARARQARPGRLEIGG